MLSRFRGRSVVSMFGCTWRWDAQLMRPPGMGSAAAEAPAPAPARAWQALFPELNLERLERLKRKKAISIVTEHSKAKLKLVRDPHVLRHRAPGSDIVRLSIADKALPRPQPTTIPGQHQEQLLERRPATAASSTPCPPAPPPPPPASQKLEQQQEQQQEQPATGSSPRSLPPPSAPTINEARAREALLAALLEAADQRLTGDQAVQIVRQYTAKKLGRLLDPDERFVFDCKAGSTHTVRLSTAGMARLAAPPQPQPSAIPGQRQEQLVEQQQEQRPATASGTPPYPPAPPSPPPSSPQQKQQQQQQPAPLGSPAAATLPARFGPRVDVGALVVPPSAAAPGVDVSALVVPPSASAPRVGPGIDVGALGGACLPLVFEMRFEDPLTGRGVSYSLPLPPTAAPEVNEAELQQEGEEDQDAVQVAQLLPPRLRTALAPWLRKGKGQPIMELAIDEGRDIALRLRDRSRIILKDVPQVPIPEVLASLSAASGRQEAQQLFGPDGRLALPGSLHRISRMVDPRSGHVQGLTLRVGRHVGGVSAIFADVLRELAAGRRRGLLLVGPPGLGKTTLLRDFVRALANDFHQSVIVVDTSNEIAGDGNPPHSCIGHARRMMVASRADQAAVLLEAVQNHTPQVLVVDEIGAKAEVAAIKAIAARGIVMLATAHGTDMSSLLHNPDLVPLLGGTETVILGDELVKKQGGNGRKTRTERRGAPVFDTLIEVTGQGRWRLHRDVTGSVDALLSGASGDTEQRCYGSGSSKPMLVTFETPRAARLAAAAAGGRGGARAYVSAGGRGEPAAAAGDGAYLLELMQSALR